MHRKVSERLVKRTIQDICGGEEVESRRHLEETMGSHYNHVDARHSRYGVQHLSA